MLDRSLHSSRLADASGLAAPGPNFTSHLPAGSSHLAAHAADSGGGLDAARLLSGDAADLTAGMATFPATLSASAARLAVALTLTVVSLEPLDDLCQFLTVEAGLSQEVDHLANSLIHAATATLSTLLSALSAR